MRDGAFQLENASGWNKSLSGWFSRKWYWYLRPVTINGNLPCYHAYNRAWKYQTKKKGIFLNVCDLDSLHSRPFRCVLLRSAQAK